MGSTLDKCAARIPKVSGVSSFATSCAYAVGISCQVNRDPDEEPESSPAERRERTLYQRHSQLFVLAFAPVMLALVLGGIRVVSGGLFSCAAACWIASGIFAIRAKRHMFGSACGGGYGMVRVRRSDKSFVAVIVGGILLVLGLGLANVALQLLTNGGE